ncbi:MAG TPA: hypothetical protein VFF06_04800 [Polyangia bacterium]|nr:hypothetical protein [Polyangia bacterium]
MTPTTSRLRGPLAALAIAATAAGCSSGYIYKPATNATSQLRGRPAADYPIPPSAPVGDVRLASFGISKITPKQAPVAEPLKAMHVRLEIANNSDQPWQLDTRDQRAELRSGVQLAPAFARSDGGELPLVRVDPNARRTVDLFFPLPAGEQKASKLPEFDVIWRLQAGPQAIAQRTPFERLYVEPVYASAYSWYYPWGPVGWYDPLWGPSVIGAPGWYW